MQTCRKPDPIPNMSISLLSHVLLRTISRFQSILKRQKIWLHPPKGLMGRTEDNPRVHFSLAPTQSSPCGSVAFSWSIEALLHLPKAKGVVVRACGRGRGAGAATLCFLLPFISWSSTHFANFASLIFPSPGGLVKQTRLPLFHRWRGSSAEGM